MKLRIIFSVLSSILGIAEGLRIALAPSRATTENYLLLTLALITLFICLMLSWHQWREQKKGDQ